MTDRVDLDELERLEKAATPGPLANDPDNIKATGALYLADGSPFAQVFQLQAGDRRADNARRDADARLWVAARNALPGMIRELRELRAEIEKLRKFARAIPSLECPCCGEEGAFATGFLDGDPTICGCGGTVMADGEEAHISLPDTDACPRCDKEADRAE